MGKLIVVAGAQYGSEGKGAVADHLSRRAGNLMAVRVAGPNAGHTVYGLCPSSCPGDNEHLFHGEWIGHPWKLRTVPVAAVSNPRSLLVIADGSEVDLGVLKSELDALDDAGYHASARLFISSQTTVLAPRHIEQERVRGLSERLGSTAKGIGAARADRIWRTANLYDGPGAVASSASLISIYLTDDDTTVLIEGTQGYGLGLHAGNYPYCTSSDCRAIDFLAMAGISPWAPEVTEFEVWLATRVRPIRVAGNSGPLKDETSWNELGLPEERTTVTNKVRRVGGWDPELVRKAIQANGGSPTVKVAMTMVDTVLPEIRGDGKFPNQENRYAHRELSRFIDHKRNELDAEIGFIGTGPVTGFFLNN